MKNYIFLSPHFPPNWENFCIGLAEKGFRVLGIAEENYDSLSSELKSSLTEYYKVDSMDNYNEMLRAIGFFTHKYGKIDYIESHNEHWLELEAKLRLDFNVDGYKPKDIISIRKKSEMKHIFQNAGIPVARGRLYANQKDLQEFVQVVDYPIIAKPDIGVGAHATYKINNKEELDQFVSEHPDVDYFLEEFVEGRIVSYDGLVDQNGEVVFEASLEYTENVMEIVADDEEIHYWIHKDIEPGVLEIGPKAVKAFKPKARFFHLEFFKTKDKGIIALEANLRPPGGFTVDMWNWANDMDLYTEYANILLNNTMEKPADDPYIVGFSCRKRKYNHIHSHEEIMNLYSDIIISHKQIPHAFQQVMGDEAYFYRIRSMEKLATIIDFISKKEVS